MEVNADLEDLLETNVYFVVDDTAEYPEPKIKFSHPEDVIFFLVQDEFGYSVEDFQITNSYYTEEYVIGTLTYDHEYGGFFDYTLIDFAKAENLTEGVWVIEDTTGHYFRGEWGFSDDDLDIYWGEHRPATMEELANFFGADFWECI